MNHAGNRPEMLKCLGIRPMATLRLVCIPHAGAGASTFSAWSDQLPPSVEVFALQMPGRENRLREAPFTDWAGMMNQVTAALDTLPQTPVALFGHSLGAVIALEAARHFSRNYSARLRYCFFSGRRWPGERDEAPADIAGLSDDAFLSLMERRYGSAGVSMENEEIRALALPVLRADVELLMSYRWSEDVPLSCPVSVFSGRSDPGTTDCDLSLWGSECVGAVSEHQFDDGHLFHMTCRDQVINAVRSCLEEGA